MVKNSTHGKNYFIFSIVLILLITLANAQLYNVCLDERCLNTYDLRASILQSVLKGHRNYNYYTILNDTNSRIYYRDFSNTNCLSKRVIGLREALLKEELNTYRLYQDPSSSYCQLERYAGLMSREGDYFVEKFTTLRDLTRNVTVTKLIQDGNIKVTNQFNIYTDFFKRTHYLLDAEQNDNNFYLNVKLNLQNTHEKVILELFKTNNSNIKTKGVVEHEDNLYLYGHGQIPDLTGGSTSLKGVVMKLDKKFNIIWAKDFDGMINQILIDSENNLFVNEAKEVNKSRIHKLDLKTGTSFWIKEINQQSHNSLLLANENNLYSIGANSDLVLNITKLNLINLDIDYELNIDSIDMVSWGISGEIFENNIYLGLNQSHEYQTATYGPRAKLLKFNLNGDILNSKLITFSDSSSSINSIYIDSDSSNPRIIVNGEYSPINGTTTTSFLKSFYANSFSQISSRTNTGELMKPKKSNNSYFYTIDSKKKEIREYNSENLSIVKTISFPTIHPELINNFEYINGFYHLDDGNFILYSNSPNVGYSYPSYLGLINPNGTKINSIRVPEFIDSSTNNNSDFDIVSINPKEINVPQSSLPHLDELSFQIVPRGEVDTKQKFVVHLYHQTANIDGMNEKIFVDKTPVFEIKIIQPKLHGVCGSANEKKYSLEDADFGDDSFCLVGDAFPENPSFPNPGETSEWICKSLDQGNDVTCFASRETEETPKITTYCGTAHDKNYLETDIGFEEDSFCVESTSNPNDIVFPSPGELVNWNCLNDSFEIVSSCEARRQLNSECGINAKNYLYSDDDYLGIEENYFCDKGIVETNNILFPGPGERIEWNCLGLNSGKDINCSAYRATELGTFFCGGSFPENALFCFPDSNFGIETTTNWSIVEETLCNPNLKCEAFCKQGYQKVEDRCILIRDEDEEEEEEEVEEEDDDPFVGREVFNSIKRFYSEEIGMGNVRLIIQCEMDTADAEIQIKSINTGEVIGDFNNVFCGTELNALDLDLRGNETKILEATLVIPEPCRTCTRTIYFTLKKISEEISIPDNNVLVVIMVILTITVILNKKTKVK